MLENLLNLVRENSREAIINNPAIPNEYNDAAIQTTTQSILSGLQQQVSGGNLEGLITMFSGQDNATNHPVINNVNQNVVSNLMARFGISNGAAGAIASSLVPVVMSKLVSKTNDPNDSSFNLPGMLSSLTGEDAGGLVNNTLEGRHSAKGNGLNDLLGGM